MGILPMFAVPRDVDQYSGRLKPKRSALLSLHENKKDRFALAGLTGVPINAVEYHGHGQDAHATKSRLKYDARKYPRHCRIGWQNSLP